MIICRATALARSCRLSSRALSGEIGRLLHSTVPITIRDRYFPLLSRSSNYRTFRSTSVSLNLIPTVLSSINVLNTDAHHAAAKQWVEGFKLEDIPKEALEVTFARSSGPGGQVCPTSSSQ